MTVLETERLYLRHFSGDDAEFIVDLLSQPSFLQYIGDRGVRSADDARRYIARGPLQSYTRYGFGLYAVELKDRRVTAGMCGLMKKPWLAHADLAYAFLPRFWSQGYAREAAAAVLDEGRDVWRLDRVLAVVTPDNAPSIRLLEKLGFAFEQTIAAPDDGAGLSMLTTSLASEGRPHVALLDADEVPEIVSVLADAFHDYPVMQYVLGDSAD